MDNAIPQPEIKADLIDNLRAMALRGATVRELVDEIVERLDIDYDPLLPVLRYFTRAFCLPLLTVLPIREWLGTDDDEEIDRLILPAIERARATWAGSGPIGPATKAGLETSQPRS
jgi:hypothetical protein